MTTANLEQQLRRASSAFAECFGRCARFAVVAPGRVNLIGEHVDYNAGLVLPMAIERQTLIVADRRRDRRARVFSTAVGRLGEFEVAANLPRSEESWQNYVRGVVAGCLAAGFDPGGFDAVIDSTVAFGGGISSSAALEVATATLVEGLAGRAMAPVRKALLCQKAEHEYAGVPCGIMDQFASVFGRSGHALLLDCRSQALKPVPLPDAGLAFLIINSNVKHELAGGEYGVRRRQCEEAAAALGVVALRDASVEQLRAARERMGPIVFCRARHVISEIDRTRRAALCLEAGDWQGFGGLMYESHASLRDDYAVSCAELDLLVELTRKQGAGVYGSRMTGGGFGGCTVSLVRAEQAEALGQAVAEGYRREVGIEAVCFTTRAADGARQVALDTATKREGVA